MIKFDPFFFFFQLAMLLSVEHQSEKSFMSLANSLTLASECVSSPKIEKKPTAEFSLICVNHSASLLFLEHTIISPP